MRNAALQKSSFATLFDPTLAEVVAKRAAQWKLPRHVCHPLDRDVGRPVDAEVAAFDAAVERAPVPEEVTPAEPQSNISGTADSREQDPDSEDTGEL
jgi:hypothetical protein